MTTYTAAGPLEATVRFSSGRLTVETSADGEATVTVEPLDPTDRHAVALAGTARIDLSGRQLTVDVPGKGWRRSSAPAVHVRLHLPPLSDLVSHTGDVVLASSGELGTVTVRTGSGEVQVGAGTHVDVKAGDASLDIGTATSVTMASARCHLRVQSVGDVSLKCGHGQAELQRTSGKVTVKGGGVALTLREATGGVVQFETGAGSAHVGVVPGTTVQLDLTSGLGEVRCDLPMEDSAPSGGAALRLRLRTGSGDVIVSRATA